MTERKRETVLKATDSSTEIQDGPQRYRFIHRDTGSSTKIQIHPQRYESVH